MNKGLWRAGGRCWTARALLMVMLLLGLPGWLATAAAVSVPAVLRLHEAQRMAPDGSEPATSVSLPDLDIARTVSSAATRRYRLTLDRSMLTAVLNHPSPTNLPLVGLYIERACTDLHLRVNGQLIHRSPHREFNRFQDCYAPQLVALPWGLLKEGSNELELQINGWPLNWVSTARRAMGLSEVLVGDYEALKVLHRRETLLSADLPAITSGGLVLLGVLTLCLLAFAPRQRHLAYFAVLSIIWAAINARGWWSLPVDSPLLREGTLVMLVGVVAWCYQRFVCLYADLQAPLLDRIGQWQLLLLPIALAAAGSDLLFSVTMASNSVATVLVAGSTVMFLLHAREPRRRPMIGMAWVFALGLTMVLLELVVSLGWIEPQASLPLRWGVPLCLVMLGGLQMMQFGRQAHQLEVMQRQLEQKIEAARSEIETNFTQLAEARIEQVTAGERKRIAADLHDDLGAKLLTIVHTSRSDRIAALGREALDEMRLSVRGLTGRPMELSEALADWRTEAMSRLSPTGIEIEWPLLLEDLPQVLGARTMVQTTRILREIFNNLIRHSQARHCVVTTQVHQERLTIEVRDDGIGFEIERLAASPSGLGLLSMQHRARQLRGDCRIESQPGKGSTVCLSLPLDGAPI